MSYLNIKEIIHIDSENKGLKNLKSHHQRLFTEQLEKSASTVLTPSNR